jgi:hypothetical protein
MATPLGVQTLTEGFKLVLTRDLTKGAFASLCEEMEQYAGRGNRFEPLEGKGIRWAAWPGREGGALGGKELRFLPTAAGPSVRFPVVEARARDLWVGDPSLAMARGRYRTQLVAYGSAPPWRRYELALMRQALINAGFWVSAAIKVGPLRYRARHAASGC